MRWLCTQRVTSFPYIFALKRPAFCFLFLLLILPVVFCTAHSCFYSARILFDFVPLLIIFSFAVCRIQYIEAFKLDSIFSSIGAYTTCWTVFCYGFSLLLFSRQVGGEVQFCSCIRQEWKWICKTFCHFHLFILCSCVHEILLEINFCCWCSGDA